MKALRVAASKYARILREIFVDQGERLDRLIALK
jgi:hypothetical protein